MFAFVAGRYKDWHSGKYNFLQQKSHEEYNNKKWFSNILTMKRINNSIINHTLHNNST